jgi:Fe-S oxidoreductase
VFLDLAAWTTNEPVKETEVAKARLIISTCPFCPHNIKIKDILRESGSTMKYFSLTELVLKVLK